MACRKPKLSYGVSTTLCSDRNWLTDGVWWRFDANAGSIDVHAVRIRSDEPLSRVFTAEQIQRVADSLTDIEVEL